MVYNVFPHFIKESPILFNVWMGCLPAHFVQIIVTKNQVHGRQKWRMHLDAMREIYMKNVPNLKTGRDKCPPSIKDPHETDKQR